jgi:p-hydroxybenzoate 3-monooxygenase
MDREGLVHHGIELRFNGEGHRIAFEKLVPGRSIVVYGQQEVVKDLVAARLATGGKILFEVANTRPSGFEGEKPFITFERDGKQERLDCDYIAGCDGFHGVSRPSIPEGVLKVFDRTYPFAWLGILARVAPSAEELIYAYTERGFALHSMRSPEVSRFYLQVPPDEAVENWSDDRIWQELRARLETVPGFKLKQGPVIEKSVTPMRSFVVEPMQYGRMFLAGDSAHIVPPTGAKGLNLAANDVRHLANALVGWYKHKRSDGLDRYSSQCLRRIWRAQHFSYWMTQLLHTFANDDAYAHKLQLSHLDYVATSLPAATTLAENYVGMEI